MIRANTRLRSEATKPLDRRQAHLKGPHRGHRMSRLTSRIAQCLETGDPFVRTEGDRSLAYRAAKRLLDLIGTLVLLVLLGPVMLAVLLILLVADRGKPLYWQRRVGYRGRIFTMVKFRTMRPDAERMQQK